MIAREIKYLSASLPLVFGDERTQVHSRPLASGHCCTIRQPGVFRQTFNILI